MFEERKGKGNIASLFGRLITPTYPNPLQKYAFYLNTQNLFSTISECIKYKPSLVLNINHRVSNINHPVLNLNHQSVSKINPNIKQLLKTITKNQTQCSKVQFATHIILFFPRTIKTSTE